MGKVTRFSAICIFLGVCLAEGYAVAVVRLAVLCVICPGYFFGQSDLDLEGAQSLVLKQKVLALHVIGVAFVVFWLLGISK